MGQNSNIGAENAVVVYGNPESFRRLIRNHGQLCKIKQVLICPCSSNNAGAADFHCEICDGKGFIYTYQRRFLVSDEIPGKVCGRTIFPFWTPVIDVFAVQNIAADVQGGIQKATIESFDSETVVISENFPDYQQKKITYSFDGWTHVEGEKLIVDAGNGLMYAPGTVYDSGYQSSNPLQAFADIAEIVRIWNIDTGKEIDNYSFYGNTIITKEEIVPEKMYVEYYMSDLTEVITNDVVTQNNNESWTHDLTSGTCRMAFYPFWDLSRGDIITLAATVLYRHEHFSHLGKELDQLWEMEIFGLNDVILDSDGKKYYLGTDYILQGRHVKWIGKKPKKGAIVSARYGYKPSYIIFEDNAQPNNLENKQFPKVVFAKSWSKTDKDEVARLSGI